MKLYILIISMALVLVNHALAKNENYGLHSSDSAITFISKAKVLRLYHEMAPFTPGGSIGIPEGTTFTDVQITRKNCSSRLGPVSYTYDIDIDPDTGVIKSITLFLSVIEILAKEAEGSECENNKNEVVKLNLGSLGFALNPNDSLSVDKISLRFLDL